MAETRSPADSRKAGAKMRLRSRVLFGFSAIALIASSVTASPAVAVQICYPAVGCNPKVIEGTWKDGSKNISICNLKPGTEVIIRVEVKSIIEDGPPTYQNITLTVQADGCTGPYTLDGAGPVGIGIDIPACVHGCISIDYPTPLYIPYAPCFPNICDPGLSMIAGITTGYGSAYSVVVDNLIPFSTATATWQTRTAATTRETRTATATLLAGKQTRTATSVVGPEGKATISLWPLDSGVTTTFTVTGYTSGVNNRPVEVTLRGSVTTQPSQGTRLVARASGVSRYSKFKTWISGDPAAAKQSTALAACRGPFKFRIQKRKTTTVKHVKRVTWRTLPGSYLTNNRSGIWYYRTVNLKKGTYRSVVADKCGLIGVVTNPVTLKK